MNMPSNRFKAGLATGRPQTGMWISLADPVAAEIAATAGFDWLCIDGEHAPNDPRSVLHQLQAIAAYPVSVIVRPATGSAVAIKQLLDVGAQTILVPMVETAEQAAALVAAVRYPPRGVRGVATTRSARWGAVDGYWDQADNEICLVVQIESARGLENLRAIAAVDGVDGLFVGPSDLGASLGHLGNASHADVRSAVSGALRAIRDTGKAAGVLTNVAGVPEYLEAGATFIGVGVDTLTLATATRQLAADARSVSRP